MKKGSFKAIISSDWNQCLAPCGPFDPILYNYPGLTSDLTTLLKEYTGNRISLGKANQRIQELLPGSLSIQQMDAYLDDSFETYKHVPELICWCLENNILFMINTTGLVGYFQRIFAKQLLPEIPVLSANPMIAYPGSKTDPPHMYDLEEIQDKSKNTELAFNSFGIPQNKIVTIGDSGGDGPHFKWGKKNGAYLIGSMIKPSLVDYCEKEDIEIHLFWGPVLSSADKRNKANEMLVDFMKLKSAIERIIE